MASNTCITRDDNDFDAFDAYHDEFQSLIAQIHQALTTTAASSSQQAAETPSLADESVSLLFEQCNDLWKQMSMEARSIQRNENSNNENDKQREVMFARVQRCKTQLAALKQEHERNRLLSSSSSSSPLAKQEDPTVAAAQAQQRRLDRARVTMAETEVVAQDISSELVRNRESMERTKANIGQFSSITETASQIIKRMSRRRGIKDK